MKKETILSFLFGLLIASLIFTSFQLFSKDKSNRYEGGVHEKGFTFILDKRTGEMRIFVLGQKEPVKINYNYENSESEK